MRRGADIGFEVDLMEEIARRVGLKPAFVNTIWETILQEMQHGRYDCIVGGITITPEREQILAWSVPYITTTLSLVVNGAKMPQSAALRTLRTRRWVYRRRPRITTRRWPCRSGARSAAVSQTVMHDASSRMRGPESQYL
jgi:hypothetical protein